ncbi:MAG: DUF559 domain-containing protein [Sphingomonadales bacterium]|nr:DUF559 domain-containing protein [Sphingomonadales bacterium]
MRANPTEPERRLWMALRDRRFAGFKFRRQAVIGKRIVDFLCPAKALVIEIDGETHDAAADAHRDAAMRRQFGLHVLRFTNLQVMREFEGVLIAMHGWLQAAPDRWEAGGATTPQPPPLKRRGS